MADNTLNFDLDAPAVPTLTLDPTPAAVPQEEKPAAAPAPEDGAAHSEYEASRWPVFLPALYHLWEGHPDPSQNVPCDLTVENTENGLRYLSENGPVAF